MRLGTTGGRLTARRAGRPLPGRRALLDTQPAVTGEPATRRALPMRYSRAMSFSFRALLLWLLVLAVPAQAASAATMALCGPNHHGPVVAANALQRSAAATHEHVGSGAQSAHAHHAPAAQADADGAGPADSAAQAKAGHADKQKCSACASCCSFGALLSTLQALPSPAPMVTVFATVVPSVDTFAADGPDRPPRISLA